MAHILVVDDDWAIKDILHDALHAEGYDVTTTDDRGALQAVHAHLPAVVLLDLWMPTIKGDEICRQLRADPTTATIPVIAMSAATNLEAVMGLSLFNDQLAKPFTLRTLFDVVARWAAA